MKKCDYQLEMTPDKHKLNELLFRYTRDGWTIHTFTVVATSNYGPEWHVLFEKSNV